MYPVPYILQYQLQQNTKHKRTCSRTQALTSTQASRRIYGLESLQNWAQLRAQELSVMLPHGVPVQLAGMHTA